MRVGRALHCRDHGSNPVEAALNFQVSIRDHCLNCPPDFWSFHVVVLLTTAKRWRKMKKARVGRAKLLFLPTKYANL